MSVDLVVASSTGLGTTPQAIQDQPGNSSGLYLTNAATGTTSLTSSGKLVFGLLNDVNGEWLQNTHSVTGVGNTYGISFFVDYNEQVRLTATGATAPNSSTTGTLTLGTIGQSGKTNSCSLVVNGGVTFPSLAPGAGTDVVCSSTGALGLQVSSARFKENIRELKEDFRRVLSLVPVSFTYKGTGQEGFGYTAEEVHEKELHNLVSYDEEGKPFSVNYKLLPVYLLEIVKQQQEMIGRLEQGLAGVLRGLAPEAEPAAG